MTEGEYYMLLEKLFEENNSYDLSLDNAIELSSCSDNCSKGEFFGLLPFKTSGTG